MKKLQDIPKKQIFSVPENYFDRLPAIIQAKVDGDIKIQLPIKVYALKYALPALIMVIIAVVWFSSSTQNGNNEVASLLASVQTEDLAIYLNDSDLTLDDVLETVEFNIDDIEDVEASVYELGVTNDEFDNIINDLD